MPQEPPSHPKHRPGPFGPAIDLIPENQKLLTVQDDQPAWEALELLSDHGFSQLPVLDELGLLVGIFTWESFSKRVLQLRASAVSVSDLPVRECMNMQYKLIAPGTYIDTEGEDWANKDFVLVGTKEKVEGILTLADIWGVLNDFAECFVLLYEIETELRDFIKEVIPEDKLLDAISRTKPNFNEHPPSSLEDFTFSQYNNFFNNQKNWRYFEPIFRMDKTLLLVELKGVASIRNALFHFRRRASNMDADSLRTFRDNRVRYFRELLNRKIIERGSPVLLLEDSDDQSSKLDLPVFLDQEDLENQNPTSVL